MQAKAAIVAEVERLHWRIWNGKAKNARHTLERVRKVMHAFQGEGVCQSARKKDPLSASKRDPFRCDLCAAMDVSLFG
jgi:hypothetical protein